MFKRIILSIIVGGTSSALIYWLATKFSYYSYGTRWAIAIVIGLIVVVAFMYMMGWPKSRSSRQANNSGDNNQRHLNRVSPLTLVSFLLFLLSWFYIIKALWISRIQWPHIPVAQKVTWTLILVCIFLGLSLIRLYVSLWRLEEDQDLVLKLCPPNQTPVGKFISLFETVIRLAALILMYLVINNLTHTDLFIIIGLESDFCYLLIAVFVSFVVWDIFAMPRLLHDALEIDRKYFGAIIATDAVSLIFAILYTSFMHAGNVEGAMQILLIFGGMALLGTIFEIIFTWSKVVHLAQRKFIWTPPPDLKLNSQRSVSNGANSVS